MLQASYNIALLSAKKKKDHTIAEEFAKPCALKMAKIVIGTEDKKKLKPLSNDVIYSRINDMSRDTSILQQMITDLKVDSVKVSIQLDESTD